jgi:PEP-CTERM motif
MIRRIVLAVAFAVLVPCLAMAGGVSFTTSGTFSNTTLFPISFTGTTVTNFSGSSNLSFGSFNVGKCPVSSCTGSETFTLTIAESSPISGTATLSGTISGTVLKGGNNNLVLNFTTATVTIGSTMYSIMFPHSLNFGSTTLNGKIGPGTSVPEPSAQFLLGMGALGLMGLTTVSRKRINV